MPQSCRWLSHVCVLSEADACMYMKTTRTGGASFEFLLLNATEQPHEFQCALRFQAVLGGGAEKHTRDNDNAQASSRGKSKSGSLRNMKKLCVWHRKHAEP